MTAINKTYNPKEVEDKWYAYWLNKNFFTAKPNPLKEPYTIVIPPPNVTGVLHMGHMLNNTIQDVLVRKARMQGKEACWVAGTDHASIATEAKVVAMLKEKGIDKKDLSREEFLKYAWEWKEKYGGIILEQLKKLGASCDWDKTRFTMEPDLSAAVIEVFVNLYKQGLIYKGFRMVNWDPKGKTAVSDEEVIHKEVNSKLYYLKYLVADSDEHIVIATTRPETIFGDTAVCVNPEDERYSHLKGKKVVIPLANRSVPVIFDDYVDMAFGTGCLKVTPAHDINDYNLGQKHNLETIDVMTDDGILNEKGGAYAGKDRFQARKIIAKDLEEAGLMVKVQEIKSNVGYSERTDAVIEPRLSSQWFVDMKKFLEKNPEVLESVIKDEIVLYPPKFKNTYRHWMENIRDWCISRQLWWGQRIPAYYTPAGEFGVGINQEEAEKDLTAKNIKFDKAELKQDEDVLDTWFSSWLWPISVFDGFKDPNNENIKYFYPTNDLVTAPEILFFWVARMIMAGYEFTGKKPFQNVYLTGIVRDKLGRKMSKSLGNSPDPLDLIDKQGADSVRFGMLLSSPAGNDLLFDDKYIEQGRNFTNKLWNAFRLVKGWQIDESLTGEYNETAISIFHARFNHALAEIEDNFSKYRLSDALMALYKLIWDDFCSWYLETVKPEYEKPIDRKTYESTLAIFEELLKVLHPFMPFITEELWHLIRDRKPMDCIVVTAWPKGSNADVILLKDSDTIQEIVTNIRNVRNAKQIQKHVELTLLVKTKNKAFYSRYEQVIKKLGVVSDIDFTEDKLEGAATFLSKADELFIPLAGELDVEKEKENIIREIEYTKGFLHSVVKKLSNEKFVNSAPPQVVEVEIRKKEDAETKIRTLEVNLAALSN